MDEDFSDLSSHVLLPDNHIRLVQINLQAQLEGFHKTAFEANLIETYSVCENVRDKVLNSEDESHLSKIHNNSRRISIASELFIDICSVYEYIVDCEFTKIINSLIQWKKFQYISKKITHKMQLELKRERYFKKEAQSKLHKSVQDGDNEIVENPREILRPTERAEIITESAVRPEKISPSKEQEFKTSEAAEGTCPKEINEVLGLTLDGSTRDEISHIIGNITEIRAESPNDTFMLQFQNSHVERQIDSLLTTLPEIPIQGNSFKENEEDDINKILQILEGDIIEKEVDQRELPETLLGTTAVAVEPAEKPAIYEETQMNQLEGTEELDLPRLEPVKRTKKSLRHVIMDKKITIHNYSERALYLNSNINIQRVQVFEGPPKVLQAMSAGHLMKTPGFRISPFQDMRSSKLTKLFDRHLKVEKKPVEHITTPEMRVAEEPKQIRFSTVRGNEVLEDIAIREGLHSLTGKDDVLAEVAQERSHLENIETSITGVLQKESLVGMPISRIICSPTAIPDREKINNVSFPHTPRVQQLQGKSLDPEMQTSWFHSTKENPPSAKYREFKYVFKKVQEYWSLFESQGLEKSITLKEFFSFEVDGSVANFLTVLRILDKLSVQRKLLLKCQNQDILIRPFESPFISEKQVLLKEQEPIL